ncbi:nuclear pore complex protein NUP50A-like [Phalaenopsis equestris]|uniref:nuclear pore complex protein NUP50A-like n=1 Tax=Phalaenopsis equestris TaxID=78828 RepID=UPI0009E5521D|nr:nuclear pore complex protein NUP50A-like [Phalaenopsis equestris]XP_020577992.1 nuclear pore complex protein NUP50A-like [Phalaenopsis equestris]XP_020577993.1 nuclear pore complex protein NUP50A-like [Phalaenopsis equestris]XP_020577994.1 nuclear pore complex protein NUP50A-like [Phalaenopsis equestris]XP_020577995.1 nuclear pore complex protein NUP50A-like [Phalaenopsis equestris]XP_020577996.1 nuclear pore complex protein NUP50A-like [Phalaenopsis equestris]
MADAENVVSASKKRVAGRQITKDNAELDDDTSEPEMGTFQKASEEVLATRRIVNVRRRQPVSSTSSNPFAGIRLVSSTEPNVKAVAQVESQNPTEMAVLKEANNANDKHGEDNKIKCAVFFDEVNGTGENKKYSECHTGAREATSNEIDSITTVKDVSQSLGAAVEVSYDKNAGAGKTLIEKPDEEAIEKPKEACEETKKEAEKISGEEVEEIKEAEVEENNMKEASGPASTFSSFRHLSSSQNAFTSLSGTGFGASSFSFGPVKEASTFTSFSFTSSNNGTSSLPLFGFTGITGGDGAPSLQEVPVETGEENEKSVFSADATLYEYLDGSWKERGRGEIKVNTSISGGKARLVMRSRGNYRLILNASLYPDMTLANMDKKGITFSCVNIAGEGRAGLTTCALKFKDSSFAEEFSGVVKEHKGKKAIALKTPENSPKASDEQREDFA